MSKLESKKSKLLQQKQEASSPDTSPEQLRTVAYTSRTLMLRVAENNAAPPELLRELAASSKAVCERVAANPNTPIDVLLKLGAKFPKQLLSNPILPLLLLENPNLIKEIPLNTLISLLKEEQVPDYILNAASKHNSEEILVLVASHINTSTSVLEHLAQSRYDRVQEVTKLHVNIVEKIQLSKEELARQVMLNFKSKCVYEINQIDLAIAQLIPDFLLTTLHSSTIRTIALHSNTSIDVLKILCGNSFDSSIHKFVASRNVSVTLLESLAKYYNQIYSEALLEPNFYTQAEAEQVFAAIASNPNTPIYLIEELYQYPSNSIHARIAENSNTPVKLLDLLSNNTNSSVRSSVAININTPANLLQILAQDKDNNIRSYVASHPNTPKRALELLAKDEVEWVRCNVAQNPNIPVNLLSILATEKSHSIRQGVAQNSQTPTSLLKILAEDEHILVRQGVAENPNTPQHLINKQLIQKSPQQLAQNLATPPSTLALLAKHPDLTVRTLLASNTNTPLEILEILARDKKDYVRHRAANNPKMCKDKFAKITLERIAKTQAPSLSRFIVFLHHQAPTEALVKNYHSSAWLERYAIAQNPNTPKHILNELTLDANQIVRAAASANSI